MSSAASLGARIREPRKAHLRSNSSFTARRVYKYAGRNKIETSCNNPLLKLLAQFLRDLPLRWGLAFASLGKLADASRLICLPRDARAKRSEGLLKLFAKTSLTLFARTWSHVSR